MAGIINLSYTDYLSDGYCIIDYNKTEKKLFAFNDCEIKEMYRKARPGEPGDLFVIDNAITRNQQITKKIYKGRLTEDLPGITNYKKAGCFKLSEFFDDHFKTIAPIILELNLKGFIEFIELDNDIQIDGIKFEDYFKKLLEEVHKCPSCSTQLEVHDNIENVSRKHFSAHYNL